MSSDRSEPVRVTDKCVCGHMVIAHSATDGCVYCRCQERHILPPAFATSRKEAP